LGFDLQSLSDPAWVVLYTALLHQTLFAAGWLWAEAAFRCNPSNAGLLHNTEHRRTTRAQGWLSPFRTEPIVVQIAVVAGTLVWQIASNTMHMVFVAGKAVWYAAFATVKVGYAGVARLFAAGEAQAAPPRFQSRARHGSAAGSVPLVSVGYVRGDDGQARTGGALPIIGAGVLTSAQFAWRWFCYLYGRQAATVIYASGPR
jgi:hypothetical protein